MIIERYNPDNGRVEAWEQVDPDDYLYGEVDAIIAWHYNQATRQMQHVRIKPND